MYKKTNKIDIKIKKLRLYGKKKQNRPKNERKINNKLYNCTTEFLFNKL